jgi:hypothetical protein
LYLPRLKDDIVFQSTLNKGSGSKEFFGFAYGKKDDEYNSFSFGKSTSPLLETLLLIEPSAACKYEESQKPVIVEQPIQIDPVPSDKVVPPLPPIDSIPSAQSLKTHFYANIELDSLVAKKQFADLVDEVILQFTSKPGVKMKISLEIEAESATGFDDSLQRAVKENCNVMKFRNAEFE